ncbi:MAG: hypothetical protein M3071_09880 [Actinomycetota bacterium]|nr:hypothetical protein [Actinomycetota bacterium]
MDDGSHQARVEGLLADAAAEHAGLLSRLPPELRASLPVDAQGLTQAIDHLATAAGLSESERRALVRPHAVNPAVLHARVFGYAPLALETVIASFVEGARVRADALSALADTVGGEPRWHWRERLSSQSSYQRGRDLGADDAPSGSSWFAT